MNKIMNNKNVSWIYLFFGLLFCISLTDVCVFFLRSSVLELVDAAIPSKELDPIKQTIFLVEGVKVSSRFLFGY